MYIGYARVSTADQQTDLQIDALTNAGCINIYQESVSSVSKSRPQLEECLRCLRKGDTLIVWRLDRLGRSLKDLVTIIGELEGREVGFRSLTESIDTTTPSGRLIFHIFGSLAEFERNLIRDRTLAGLAAARARGRKGGRRPKMTTRDIQKAAAMLSDPKITKSDVAAHFNVSRVTLNASLRRTSYA
ncbi:recombinase family protein [Zhongshania borealis]|uniref:Recombinase family protein n=1 Tax=Zhongshania borealis TaxID=889488 RepID=A0ABP7WLH1_9GAMM